MTRDPQRRWVSGGGADAEGSALRLTRGEVAGRHGLRPGGFHPMRDRDQAGAIAHVAGMQPTALVVERAHERPEPAPGEEIGQGDRRLHLARAIDESLQVVKAAEKGPAPASASQRQA